MTFELKEYNKMDVLYNIPIFGQNFQLRNFKGKSQCRNNVI